MNKSGDMFVFFMIALGIILVLLYMLYRDVCRHLKFVDMVKDNNELLKYEECTNFNISDTDPYLSNGCEIVLEPEVSYKTKVKKLYVDKELKDKLTNRKIYLWYINDAFIGYSFDSDAVKFAENISMVYFGKVSEILFNRKHKSRCRDGE